MGFIANLSSLVASNLPNSYPEMYSREGEEEEEQKPLKKKLKKSPTQEEEGERKVTQRKTDPGRRVISGRIYDSKLGVTCHWCRQKTVEDHAFCRNCNIAFCGLCLRNRHNERVKLEMAKSSNWLCPKCRGGCGEGCLNCCNCGPCRKSQGLEPTGTMIRKARLAEFTNVHDYLVHLKTGESQEIISQRKLGKGWCISIDFKETEKAELEKPLRRSKPKADHPAIQSIKIESIRRVKSEPDSKVTITANMSLSKITNGGGYNLGSLKRVKIKAEDASHKSAIPALRKTHSHQAMGNRTSSNLEPLKAVKAEVVDDASCLNHSNIEVGKAVNPFLQVKVEPEMWVKAEAEDEVNINHYNSKTELAQNGDKQQGPLIKVDMKPAVEMVDLDRRVEEESTVCQSSEENDGNESSIRVSGFPTQIPMDFGDDRFNYSAFRIGEVKEEWTLPREDFQYSSVCEVSDLESHQLENGGNFEDCLHSPQMRNLTPCELKQLDTGSLMSSAKFGVSSIEPLIDSSLQTFATVKAKEEGREMILPEGSDLCGTQSQMALSETFATVKVKEEGRETTVTPTKMSFSHTFAAVKVKEEMMREILPEVSDICGTQNQMACLLPAVMGFNEPVVGSEKVIMDSDDQSYFEEDFEEHTFSSTPTTQKSNNGENLIRVLDDDQGEQNTSEVLKVSAEKRGSARGLPSSVRRSGNFKQELEKRLNEAFCLEQLSEMWEAIIERKPVYKVRVTRQGMSSFATQEEGISYLDHYPDLADRLALTDESAEKLKLLRGFFFWLQHASAPDAFRPWFESSSNKITADDDCAEIDGPDCEILAVVHAVDDQTSDQNWTVEAIPPVSLKMEI